MADHLPIVFLPGIMSSRLHFLNSGKYWDPDSTLRMTEWIPALLRTPDKLRQEIHFLEPVEVVSDDPHDRGWSGVAATYYGDFLKNLQARFPNAPVYAVGYDWRQDNWSTADVFLARVQEILEAEGATQVQVITHSMGGLVFRAALEKSRLSGNPLADRVKGVVHVFQPVFGAVVLYRRLFTGVQVPGLDGDVTLQSVSGSLSNLTFAWILGDTPILFIGNASGLPGAIQLLPTDDYPLPPWNGPLTSHAKDLNNYYLTAANVADLMHGHLSDVVTADLRERFQESSQFNAFVRGRLHPNSWTICGQGLKTDTQISFDGSSPVPFQAADGGDATVPFPSASGLPLGEVVPFDTRELPDGHRQFVISGVIHAYALAGSAAECAERGPGNHRKNLTIVVVRTCSRAFETLASGSEAGFSKHSCARSPHILQL